MTRRILPPEEWSKLDATALGPAWRAMAPESSQVVVVEDDGQIIACWCLVTWAHVEGLWIADAHQKRTGAARHLLMGMKALCADRGIDAVVTHADTEDVAALVLHAGGHRLPGDAYVLPFVEPVKTYDALGAHFHTQLFTLMPAAVHADDPAHDRAVGRALYTAMVVGEIDRAVTDYNAWALTSGYEPIEYLGQRDDESYVLDIVEAVIAINRQFTVSLLESRLCQSAQR
jgi:hypothetical protein